MDSLVLHFAKEDKAQEAVMVEDLQFILQEVFGVQTFSAFSKPEKLPTLASLYAQEKISKYALKLEMRNAIVELLQACCGMKSYLFQSRDDDEVFCRVSCPDDVLLKEANYSHYLLKMNPKLETVPSVEEYVPYIPYSSQKHEEDPRLYESGMLRDIDKLRLSEQIIRDRIHLEALKKYEILIDMYILHSEEEKKALEKKMSSWYMDHIPEEDLRNYFGEKTALYFSWLNFYTKFLVPFAAAGLLLWFYRGLIPGYGFAELLFGIITCVWAAGFQIYWSRKSAAFGIKYGTEGAKNRELVRESFKGKMIKNSVTQESELVAPMQEKVVRHIITYFTTFFLIGLVVVLTISLFIYRAILLKSGKDQWGPTICAVVNSLQIYTMVVLYDKLAIKLTDWENHKTVTNYENSLVVKRVGYQFVNYYISLFYIAFVKQHFEGCDHGNCMGELNFNLWIMFLLNMIFNIIEIGLPFLQRSMSLRAEDKKVKEMFEQGKITRTEMSPCEYQSKLSKFSLLDEYLELAMNFGYIIFFSVAFPLGPVIYLVFNVLELKGDLYKFMYLCKRPSPELADSIGVWADVMNFMSIVAIVTNTGLIFFTMDWINLDYSAKWSAFFVVEHLLLFITIMLFSYYPRTSGYMKDVKKRQNYLKGIHFYKNITNEGVRIAYEAEGDPDLNVNFKDKDQ